MSEQAAPPNVLLICTDHWPGLLMRPAGHPVVMTPTLERLSRNGVTFTNTYSACPVCVPARRTLMTGMSPRGHGVNHNSGEELNPEFTTLAQAFRNAGYQSFGVGKLHVNPQRNRIGFDDVILNEEGRRDASNRPDDWELYLSRCGFPGQGYANGLAQNDYLTRSWHLPEHCHPTNWAVQQMCEVMHRRDPRKPGFWYLSFIGPHPPICPPQAYMDLYRDVVLDEPIMGDWARDVDQLPSAVRSILDSSTIGGASQHEIALARRAFYATLTHIDHQVRVVIGYLREQGLIDNTIIAFTADHGEMLGDHGLWSKAIYYEMATRVPLIIQPQAGYDGFCPGTQDHRLTELQDVMPTLLDMAGIAIPSTVEGLSLAQKPARDFLYGEIDTGARASRMIRRNQYKLIYYPTGNRRQLFDIASDPREMHDLAASPAHAPVLGELTRRLIGSLYGDDTQWLQNGALVGLPEEPYTARVHRDFFGQRGLRFV